MKISRFQGPVLGIVLGIKIMGREKEVMTSYNILILQMVRPAGIEPAAFSSGG